MKSKLICFVLMVWGISFSAISSFSQKFDVQITLDKIACKKAVELWPDTQDDLYGKIDIVSYVMNAATGAREKYGYYKGTPSFYNELTAKSLSGNILWTKREDSPLRLATGQTVTSGAGLTISNLTLSQVLSIEFLVGGVLHDDEVVNIRYQPCTSCGFNFAEGSSLLGSALNYRIMKLSSYQSQIESITTGTSKFLKIGDDQYFQLDFFETDQNSAHVQFVFTLFVTKRSFCNGGSITT